MNEHYTSMRFARSTLWENANPSSLEEYKIKLNTINISKIQYSDEKGDFIAMLKITASGKIHIDYYFKTEEDRLKFIIGN